MGRSNKQVIKANSDKTPSFSDIPGINIASSKTIGSLWAGYGRVIQLTADDGTPYVAKSVEPPSGDSNSSISHNRKLHSYQVEATFYQTAAPQIAASEACHIPVPHYVDCNLELSGTDHGHMLLVLSDLKPNFPNRHSGFSLQHTKSVLSWLAAFHAHFWQHPRIDGLWEQGCYWHLATRLEEAEDIPREWQQLREQATAIDKALHEGPGVTLLHGDAKAANFLFNDDYPKKPIAAAYDFQYVGYGEAMKDVAYLLCSSVNGGVLGAHEDELLHHYHTELTSKLTSEQAAEYPLDYMKGRLELAVADFVRFMAGWGWWGNTSWAERKAKSYLKKAGK